MQTYILEFALAEIAHTAGQFKDRVRRICAGSYCL
jgi:hypothetical protein